MALISLLLTQVAFAMSMGPTPFPVFLKEGFSSILEFEEAPTKVVLGDQNLFQVERLDHSIVIKPVTAYATTNMFVYFKNKETRLFILSAAEDNQPTYFKKFTSILLPKNTEQVVGHSVQRSKGVSVRNASSDSKKDYLTVDFSVRADSSAKLIPDWNNVRLKYKDRYITPSKIWSARREVQRNAIVSARAIFTKPNVPSESKELSIVVPLTGSTITLTAALNPLVNR